VSRSTALSLWAVLGTAILSRVAVWFAAIVFPIPNELGIPISPVLATGAPDLMFYTVSRDAYLQILRSLFHDGFVSSSAAISGLHYSFMSGPVVPILMIVFDYDAHNPVPISMAYLAMGIAWGSLWVIWLLRRGVAVFLLMVFVLLPAPLWFMLNVGSDLPFALAVAGFYVAYFSAGGGSRRRLWLLVLFAVLAVATRPNGISLVVFLAIVALFDAGVDSRIRWVTAMAAGAAALALAAIYQPHFWAYARLSPERMFFGLPYYAYLDGLMPFLPNWLDRPLSWITLIGVKLLYLVGLRPSFGETPLVFVLVRASAWVVLLPGLVWWLVRGDWRQRLFLITFLAPIMIGIAQERYILPIMPVLFYYGVDCFRHGVVALRSGRLAARSR
jgi:hypothetical protein